MNLFSGLKGEGMNKVQSELEKFAEEFNQLCEKFDVYVYSNFQHEIAVVKYQTDGSEKVTYLKGDRVA